MKRGAQPRADRSVAGLLARAVDALHGVERPGQQQMAAEVARAFAAREHLVVQAGTGTGKSLGYLVPAIHLGKPVVIATSTLALQTQLVEHDLPVLADAVEPALGRRPTYAVVKGRANYVCRHRMATGVPDDTDALIEVQPRTQLGREVLRLTRWANETTTGDRDELIPGVTDRVWSQVAVSARECLGREQCPFGEDCFVEDARELARHVDIVVTNHAMLAIDALHNRTILPPHDYVVVDEAHDLAARVTSAAADELSVPMAERVVRRARPHIEADVHELFEAAVDDLGRALATTDPGRMDELPAELGAALAGVRDAARRAISSIERGRAEQPQLGGDETGDADDANAARKQAMSLVTEVYDVAVRLLDNNATDVAWAEERRDLPTLHVAPLSVAGILRDKLFADRTVVLTSATVALGGTYDTIARVVGLTPDAAHEPVTADPADDGVDDGAEGADDVAGADDADEPTRAPRPCHGIDVGSPFAYDKQAILYVARRLPPPGRGSTGETAFAELLDLMTAAGGRTLGLFSSRRAAEAAAAYVAERSDLAVLCQGEATLADLGRRFRHEPATSLFGTLSLWQGIDVPGGACQLVAIDRIPFPRPDDPLMSARSRAVEQAGGNGFLTVSVAHAALLLAQGVGRLIRRDTDRGVVAILDSRLATARYAPYLVRSLPPMWRTTDRDTVLAALRRLDAEAAADDAESSGPAAAER